MDDDSFGQRAAPGEALQKLPGAPFDRRQLLLWLGRALTPLSALLLLIAVRLPWARLDIAYGDVLFDAQFSGMDGILRLGSLDGRSGLLGVVLFLLWDVAPVCGLFLCLALSIRRRISWLPL